MSVISGQGALAQSYTVTWTERLKPRPWNLNVYTCALALFTEARARTPIIIILKKYIGLGGRGNGQ